MTDPIAPQPYPLFAVAIADDETVAYLGRVVGWDTAGDRGWAPIIADTGEQGRVLRATPHWPDDEPLFIADTLAEAKAAAEGWLNRDREFRFSVLAASWTNHPDQVLNEAAEAAFDKDYLKLIGEPTVREIPGGSVELRWAEARPQDPWRIDEVGEIRSDVLKGPIPSA